MMLPLLLPFQLTIHNATNNSIHYFFFLFLLIAEHFHKNIIRMIMKVHLTINAVFLVVVLIISPSAMDSIFDKVFALQIASHHHHHHYHHK